METTEQKADGRTRAILGIAGLAVAAIAIGGALTLRALGDGEAASNAPVAAAVPAEEASKVQRGRNSPAAFGLPVYPGSFQFNSMGPGKESGSAAFRVKKGTAVDVVRFYVEKLGEKGWEFESRQELTLPTPGGQGKGLPGIRAAWTSADGKRELSLMAFDDKKPAWTAQAVLAWNGR